MNYNKCNKILNSNNKFCQNKYEFSGKKQKIILGFGFDMLMIKFVYDDYKSHKCKDLSTKFIFVRVIKQDSKKNS